MQSTQPTEVLSQAIVEAIERYDSSARKRRWEAAFTTGVALGIDEAKLLHVLNRAARDRTDPLVLLREREDLASGEQVAAMTATYLQLDYTSAATAQRLSTGGLRECSVSLGSKVPQDPRWLPVSRSGAGPEATLTVLCENASALQDARNRLNGVNLETSIASRRTLRELYQKHFTNSAAQLAAAQEELIRWVTTNEQALSSNVDTGIAAQTIEIDSRYCLALLAHAAYAGASDVQIQPLNTIEGVVRMRFSGSWVRVHELPFGRAKADGPYGRVCNAIARLARIDTSAPGLVMNDGRISLLPGQPVALHELLQHYMFRVVSGRALGEHTTLTLRVQDLQNDALDLESVGLTGDDLQILRRAMRQGSGLVLTVGPTGGGKTTLLYAALREINQLARSIQTVERPVEYILRGAAQYELSFIGDEAEALKGVLRGLMRNAPNVLLLGEIRDRDVADMAVQFSLTGHIALSSMHADGVVGALERLKRFGLDGDALASQLLAIVAVRLVRLLCQSCRLIDDSPLAASSAGANDLRPVSPKRYRRNVAGCEHCAGPNPGYAGRRLLYELFAPDRTTRTLVADGAINAHSDAFVPPGRRLADKAIMAWNAGEIDRDELALAVPASQSDGLLQ